MLSAKQVNQFGFLNMYDLFTSFFTLTDATALLTDSAKNGDTDNEACIVNCCYANEAVRCATPQVCIYILLGL